MMEAVREPDGTIVDFLITAANGTRPGCSASPSPRWSAGGSARTSLWGTRRSCSASTPTSSRPANRRRRISGRPSPRARELGPRADREGRRRHRTDVERHHRAEAHRDRAPERDERFQALLCTRSTSCASWTGGDRPLRQPRGRAGPGLQLERVPAFHPFDLVHPDDLERASSSGGPSVAGRRPITFEVRAQHADGGTAGRR